MCELTLPETNIDNIENGPFEYVFHGISYWIFFSSQLKGTDGTDPKVWESLQAGKGSTGSGAGNESTGGVWVSSSLVFFRESGDGNGEGVEFWLIPETTWDHNWLGTSDPVIPLFSNSSFELIVGFDECGPH